MKYRKLEQNLEVSAMGLGCMGMSFVYGKAGDKNEMIALIHAGDIVEISANVEHWHGASANSKFIHIGMTPKASENKAEWLEPVKDEENNSL